MKYLHHFSEITTLSLGKVLLSRWGKKESVSSGADALSRSGFDKILNEWSPKNRRVPRKRFEDACGYTQRLSFVNNSSLGQLFNKDGNNGYNGRIMKIKASNGRMVNYEQNDYLIQVLSHPNNSRLKEQFRKAMTKSPRREKERRNTVRSTRSEMGGLAESVRGQRARVTASSLNFRSSPRTGNNKVGSLRRGTQIVSLGERSGGWLKVQMPNGRVAWASARYIQVEGGAGNNVVKRGKEKSSRRRSPERRYGTSDKLVYKGLSKRSFISKNKPFFQKYINDANARLQRKTRGRYVPLKMTDVTANFNAELAVRGGKVNPNARHSEGERGLFPLPERSLKTWLGVIGLGRPRNISNPKVNIATAIRTLAGYKNYGKHKNLFVSGIRGNAVKEAQLTAAITHGYFYSGNYTNRSVPTQRILSGIKRGVPIDQVMRGTRYKHAKNKSLMEGRRKNLDAGVRMA